MEGIYKNEDVSKNFGCYLRDCDFDYHGFIFPSKFRFYPAFNHPNSVDNLDNFYGFGPCHSISLIKRSATLPTNAKCLLFENVLILQFPSIQMGCKNEDVCKDFVCYYRDCDYNTHYFI